MRIEIIGKSDNWMENQRYYVYVNNEIWEKIKEYMNLLINLKLILNKDQNKEQEMAVFQLEDLVFIPMNWTVLEFTKH